MNIVKKSLESREDLTQVINIASGIMVEEAALETVEEQEIAGEDKLAEVSLKFECPDLPSRLGAMLTRGLWLDCELIVGSTKEPIRAHRIILASASSVLAIMLDRNPGTPIVLSNIELEVFKIVLQYIYTDKIEITSWEIACSVYEAANFFILPGLEAKIKDYLINQVSAECVLHVYEFAKKFHIKDLVEKYLNKMETKSEEILMETKLETVQADTLEDMFALENLNISSELQLFKAAERWLRAHTETNQDLDTNLAKSGGDAQPVNEKDGEIGTAIKNKIRNALCKIRFLALQPVEFADYDTTSLLTTSEIAAIALNIYSLNTYMPMPVGFSLERKKRFKIYEVQIDLDKLGFVEVSSVAGDKIKWKLENIRLISPKINNKIGLVLYCDDINDNISTDNVDWSCDAKVEVSILGIEGNKYILRKGKHHFTYVNGLVLTENLGEEELDSDYIRDNKLTLELKVRAQEPVLKTVPK